MKITYERKIEALGGAKEGDGEYNAGYHDGYNRAVEDAKEIASEADAVIEELIETISSITNPTGYRQLSNLIGDAEHLVDRLNARLG